MTKVKDLATVNVDNAFLLFPVDKERYELFVRVRDWVSDGVRPIDLLHEADEVWRVKEWYSYVHKNLTEAALAFRQIYVCKHNLLNGITVDRARRVQATLLNYHYGHMQMVEYYSRASTSIVVQALWEVVVHRMGTTPGFLSTVIENDRRNPT
jgi:hypothetical protein